MNDSRVEPSSSSYSSWSTWWIVFSRELSELWIGGKALTLLLIYTILLGIYAYVMASNSAVNLMPPKEMVFELVKTAIEVGLFIGLLIGADSISGERERATLEGLLLTPTSRRQIVMGKFLAAVSAWPVAFAVTVPYAKVLSQGNEVFGQGVLLGALLGSLLAPALTGLGMLVSYWCNTNKSSMFVSVALYILLLIPAELPGGSRFNLGALGVLVKQLNPMESSTMMLLNILVDARTFGEVWAWLIAPVLFLLLVLEVLFWHASPRLRLEAGGATRLRSYWGRAVGLWGRVAGFAAKSP